MEYSFPFRETNIYSSHLSYLIQHHKGCVQARWHLGNDISFVFPLSMKRVCTRIRSAEYHQAHLHGFDIPVFPVFLSGVSLLKG